MCEELLQRDPGGKYMRDRTGRRPADVAHNKEVRILLENDAEMLRSLMDKARLENKGDLKLLMRLEDHIHWSAVCAVISLATFAVDMRSGTSEGGSDLFGLGTHPFFENP